MSTEPIRCVLYVFLWVLCLHLSLVTIVCLLQGNNRYATEGSRPTV